jgi:hypothetical protein
MVPTLARSLARMCGWMAERIVMGRLAGMQESYQKFQTQLRKAEIEIIKDPKMTDAQKKLERQRLTVERDKLATEINREYLRTAK